MSQKSDNRREQIFRIGASLFAEKGYERTSLKEVADRLGLTKPALYYYYPAKEDLLYAIMSFVMDRVLAEITDIRSSDLSPLGKLETLIRRYIGFFALHPAELTIMSTQVESLGQPRRDEIEARQREYVAHARALIGEILAAHPGGRHVHDTSVVFALLGGMNWIFKWYDPAGKITPEALAEDFYRVFTIGLIGTTSPNGE